MTLMQPGTQMQVTPEISAVVVSDERVLQRGDDLAIGRVTLLNVGGKLYRQCWWFQWGAPDCPLHHIDSEWVS